MITLLVIIFLIILWKGASAMWGNYLEEEVVTTTTTQHPVVGELKRGNIEGQYFVIDPIDQKKIWLNDTDDLYEDVDGKIWKLV
jgi:hypothetical protein